MIFSGVVVEAIQWKRRRICVMYHFLWSRSDWARWKRQLSQCIKFKFTICARLLAFAIPFISRRWFSASANNNNILMKMIMTNDQLVFISKVTNMRLQRQCSVSNHNLIKRRMHTICSASQNCKAKFIKSMRWRVLFLFHFICSELINKRIAHLHMAASTTCRTRPKTLSAH